MHLWFSLCALYFTTFMLQTAAIVQKNQRVSVASSLNYSWNLKENLKSSVSEGYSNIQRRKRGFISAGVAALSGLKALKNLLRGLKPLPPQNKMYRDFEKHGDYRQTLKDFYSVQPTDIRSFKARNAEDVLVGRVGDRTIMTQKRGRNGKPTLRIMKSKLYYNLSPRKLMQRNIDRIIYTDS